MKTSRWVLGVALAGSLISLVGCGGSGTYQIPNVAPVVKQKPDDDLLENIEGGDDKPSESKPSEAPKSKSSDSPKPDAVTLPETGDDKPSKKK